MQVRAAVHRGKERRVGSGSSPVADSRQVACPACGTVLLVPVGCSSRVAKCGHCKQKFWLPRRLAVSEEAVVEWIGPRESEEEPATAAADGPHEHLPRPIPDEHADHATPHDTLVAAQSNLRVLQCDARGVVLEFPVGRLTDVSFRCAMPRVCMQCGGRSHLEAHVIHYVGTLADSVSATAERSVDRLVLTTDEVKDLSTQDLLDRLPRVPNAPPPADLPMPYWLCDLCSSAKAVSGQVQVNPQTGEGHCRLHIRNARRAEEFLAAIGARGTPCYQELVRHVAAIAENPWDQLPIVIQHRVEQWYKPAPQETFLTYVPDRARARTEDGMTGLVVTDRRMIHHSRLRHHEWPIDKPVYLMLEAARIRGQLRVTITPRDTQIVVDGEGIARLRRALTKGRFRAAWR